MSDDELQERTMGSDTYMNEAATVASWDAKMEH